MRYSFWPGAAAARLDAQAAVANADSQVVAPDALAERLLVDVQAGQHHSGGRPVRRADNFTGAPLLATTRTGPAPPGGGEALARVQHRLAAEG
jgi:hypothetical protein